MIRSNVPLPFLFRLRMRANFVAGRAQSRLGACQRTASPTLTQPPSRTAQPDDSPAAWEAFVDTYERLTGVICAAARWGVTPHREQEYISLRRWLGDRYASVAHRVRQQPAFAAGQGQTAGRALDNLEKILVYASLHDLLAHDRGDLIPRVAGISQAIYSSFDA